MMIGDVRITLLQRGETYIATLPYASCKGIMFGTLSMEYGGKVSLVSILMFLIALYF